MSIGAVIANFLTVRLLDPLGWRGAFMLYALAGVAWALAFVAWFRNTPAQHRAVNAAELKLIRGDRVDPHRLQDFDLDATLDPHAPPQDAEPSEDMSMFAVLASMARSLSMWALCSQAFFRSFGYALFITWFPAYLEKGYGIEKSRAGDLGMLPLVGVVLGSFLGGPIIDAILVRTGSRWLSRCGVAFTSLGLCGVATFAATLMGSPTAAVVMLSVGAFLSGLASPTTWAATMDISGRYTALGFAVMNISGNVGAIACPHAVAYLIATIEAGQGNWSWVLYMCAIIYLCGSVSWLALDPNKSAVERRTTSG